MPETNCSPPIPLLREDEVAAMLSVQIGTIRQWRQNGLGPPHIKLGDSKGAAVRYRLGDVEAWLQSKATGA